ncbi:MAG: tRNA (uridine(34)/cytosine(34)/5-carboxymethylaminomethyluridine(34)-2'-O)-methyltransferase TrmL [Syntrophomonadaceae bacterium]|nr:tRNA (uridine(34)/cytosine(34)/5-carboxymethylaminomethyluridine(34)-2'-O)-methyltransferase TrmL [Syntrophomonadaceae bacterium]
MHIVLVEPEIPQNTGNIARTCALTNTTLHLVRPLGFSLEDRYLKRAGLDYWDKVELKLWDSFEELAGYYAEARFFLATTRSEQNYHQVQYPHDSFLVFGKETKGLPKGILDAYPDGQIRIPMRDIGRSLNLANSAAIILYEALRQNEFNALKQET